ncbi:hypothetical protein MVEN_01990500 [Mycena venus]|uniref:Uncharacterized protein n=1 Tax=Mycena venus TaxID=2733690 RepID=A0A8H6XD48_9AGAR|nr:hypothetical protein MVEN_01990500 [Mycena venus]
MTKTRAPHQLPLAFVPAFVADIIKNADQQANIFLRQKSKVSSSSALPFLFLFSSSLPFLLPSSYKYEYHNDALVAQVAGPEKCARIINAIHARDGEMMMHRIRQVRRSALSRDRHGP